MPYGYGASQDYYDRAVQERDRNTGGNTGNNNQNNQGNQGDNDGRSQAIQRNIEENRRRKEEEKVAQLYGNKFGAYDTGQKMATGFGSVFGASSGSTGSSQAVQKSLQVMIDNELRRASEEKGGLSTQQHNEAVKAAFNKMYPKIDQYTEEEFVNLYGEEARGDWLAANASTIPGYANLMGIPPGQVGIDQLNLKGFGGSGGGVGGYGGWGSGGGGGGGLGWMLPSPGYKPEQMAGFYTPQANLQQAMVNVHGTPTVFKKRGGIVSLLRLGS
jgi:hypothetical protein